jgi:hypothetical protein
MAPVSLVDRARLAMVRAARSTPFADRVEDDHDWMHDSSKDEQEKAEGTSDDSNLPSDLDRTKQDDDFKTSLPPGTGIGDKTQFMQDNSVSLKWASLLEEISPFMFKHGPKLAHQLARGCRARRPLWEASDMRLPGMTRPGDDYKGRNKPAIVMALDTSLSIGQEQSNQFVNMARSVPQHKIKLFVCTFTTGYEVLDLENPQWHSGGTAFDPISEYIENVVMPENHKALPLRCGGRHRWRCQVRCHASRLAAVEVMVVADDSRWQRDRLHGQRACPANSVTCLITW